MSFFKTIRFINQHALAKKHKMQAYGRFIRWQVSQQLYQRTIVYPFVGNTFLRVKRGMTGATGNIYTGLHDFEDMGFLLHFLRPGDLFIDVGANIGSYTILAAGVSGADCLAIEPVPKTFKKLQDNISINQLKNRVMLLNHANGASRKELLFTKELDTVNHVVMEDSRQHEKNVIKVVSVPLDDLITETRQIMLLKIDVEGFEQEVLNGAKALLKNNQLQAIIIELNGSGGRYGFDEQNIHLQLKEAGFSSFQYDPFTRIITAVNVFGNFNTIYIRDASLVQSRVTASVPFTVFGEKI